MASKITAAISYSRNWLSSALLNASFLLAPKQRITASIWGRGGGKTGILNPRGKRAIEMIELNIDNAGN